MSGMGDGVSYKALFNETTFDGDDVNISNLVVSNSIKMDGAIWIMDQVDNTSIRLHNNKLEVKDLGISTSKIQDLAVTTAKIAEGAVTTPKLANNSVTTAKLAPASVSTNKIQDEAVTDEKILSVSADKILQPFNSLMVDTSIYVDNIEPLSTDRDFVIVAGAQISPTTFNSVDIGNLSSTVGTNTGNIATLQGQVATNTGNIATNTGNIATNTGNIATLENNQDILEGRLDDQATFLTDNIDQSVRTDATPTFSALFIDGPLGSSLSNLELGENSNSPYIILDAGGHYGGYRLVVTRTPFPHTPAGTVVDYSFHPYGGGGYIVNSKNKLNWDMDTFVSSTNSTLSTHTGNISTLQGEVNTNTGKIAILESADSQNVKVDTYQAITAKKTFNQGLEAFGENTIQGNFTAYGNINLTGPIRVPSSYIETSATTTVTNGAIVIPSFTPTTVMHTYGGFTWNNTTRELTIPYNGLYLVTAAVYYPLNPVGTRNLHIYVNGTYRLIERRNGMSQNQYITISGHLWLEAGDKVDMRVQQDSGATLTIGGSTIYQRTRLGMNMLYRT